MTSDPFQADRLDRGKIRFENVAGTRTRYWEAGSGTPLVLVHGGEFGDLYSLDTWSLNLTGLRDDFHVFAFDRLGQGLTGNPARADEYTIEAVMEHATRFVEDIVAAPAHLVGHSRGGYIVMRLVVENPHLAQSVTIVDSNTAAPDNPEFPVGQFYEELARRYPGPPSTETVYAEPAHQSYSPAHITDDFLKRRREIACQPKVADAFGEIAWREQWQAGIDVQRQETLERIDRDGIPIPVLVVWGRDDPSAPLPLGFELYERICARSANAQLHVINRAGHYAFREHPRAFNTVVRAFCLPISLGEA